MNPKKAGLIGAVAGTTVSILISIFSVATIIDILLLGVTVAIIVFLAIGGATSAYRDFP